MLVLCPAATSAVIVDASKNNPALSLPTLRFLSGLGKQTTSDVKDWLLNKNDKAWRERLNSKVQGFLNQSLLIANSVRCPGAFSSCIVQAAPQRGRLSTLMPRQRHTGWGQKPDSLPCSG